MTKKKHLNWIRHDGGSCPVACNTRVEVFTFREIKEGWTSEPKPACEWRWEYLGTSGDILAYAIVEGSNDA